MGPSSLCSFSFSSLNSGQGCFLVAFVFSSALAAPGACRLVSSLNLERSPRFWFAFFVSFDALEALCVWP